MQRLPQRSILIALLLAASAAPAAAQYRRQVEVLTPPFAFTASLGALLSYDETMNPIETPEPGDQRRGLRSIGTSPTASVALRYGRGIAIYASVAAALTGDADLSGNDPLTGAQLEGTDDTGVAMIYSAGASFTPLPDVMGLRLQIGPSWMDLGNGGSYLALHVAAAAKFVEIGDRGGIVLAWDGYFAGGQHDRDGVEYQIRRGRMSGVRAGYELTF